MIRHAYLEPGDAGSAAKPQFGDGLKSVANPSSMPPRSTGGPATSAQMKASRRAGVILRLHQRLQARIDDHVCLDQLLGDICRDVAEASETGNDVIMRLDFHPMVAFGEIASALGLIIAELVGDALEHAFKSHKGSIWVTLDTAPVGYRLSVEDDGAGFARRAKRLPNFSVSRARRLTEQIHGRIDVVSSKACTSIAILGSGARSYTGGYSA